LRSGGRIVVTGVPEHVHHNEVVPT
jgi:hypothetical protein